MQLARSVVVTGDESAMDEYRGKTIKLQLGDVSLRSVGWGTKDEWLFVCSIPADGAVELRDGLVDVDTDVVSRIDDAIHQTVALFTVAQQAVFSASCVAPVLGLLGPREELRALEGYELQGLKPVSAVAQVKDSFELTSEIVSALEDRSDGLLLLAEALSDRNLLGRYVQLLRLMEHAFGSQLGSFNRELMDFLADEATRHRFTRQEISQWVESRPRVMHADRPDKPIWYARNVARAVHRLQEAATDVLFNKARWRQRDAERRGCRVPRRGTIDADAGMFLTKGYDFQSTIAILEPFGSFPLFLGKDTERLVPYGLWATAVEDRLLLRYQGVSDYQASAEPIADSSSTDVSFVSGARMVVYDADDDSSGEPE